MGPDQSTRGTAAGEVGVWGQTELLGMGARRLDVRIPDGIRELQQKPCCVDQVAAQKERLTQCSSLF